MIQQWLGVYVGTGVLALLLIGCSETEQEASSTEAPVALQQTPSSEPSPKEALVAPDRSSLAEPATPSQPLDLSIDRQLLLLLGVDAAKGGYSNPAVEGQTPSGSPNSSPNLRLNKAEESASAVSFSGGLLTKENEPDYRKSVEGAKVGVELKY